MVNLHLPVAEAGGRISRLRLIFLINWPGRSTAEAQGVASPSARGAGRRQRSHRRWSESGRGRSFRFACQYRPLHRALSGQMTGALVQTARGSSSVQAPVHGSSQLPRPTAAHMPIRERHPAGRPERLLPPRGTGQPCRPLRQAIGGEQGLVLKRLPDHRRREAGPRP
jgi:hypothetical protein